MKKKRWWQQISWHCFLSVLSSNLAVLFECLCFGHILVYTVKSAVNVSSKERSTICLVMVQYCLLLSLRRIVPDLKQIYRFSWDPEPDPILNILSCPIVAKKFLTFKQSHQLYSCCSVILKQLNWLYNDQLCQNVDPVTALTTVFQQVLEEINLASLTIPQM